MQWNQFHQKNKEIVGRWEFSLTDTIFTFITIYSSVYAVMTGADLWSIIVGQWLPHDLCCSVKSHSSTTSLDVYSSLVLQAGAAMIDMPLFICFISTALGLDSMIHYKKGKQSWNVKGEFEDWQMGILSVFFFFTFPQSSFDYCFTCLFVFSSLKECLLVLCHRLYSSFSFTFWVFLCENVRIKMKKV